MEGAEAAEASVMKQPNMLDVLSCFCVGLGVEKDLPICLGGLKDKLKTGVSGFPLQRCIVWVGNVISQAAPEHRRFLLVLRDQRTTSQATFFGGVRASANGELVVCVGGLGF